MVIPLVNLARSSLYLARVTLIAREQKLISIVKFVNKKKGQEKKNPPNTQSTSLIPTRRYEEVEWKGGREREKNKKLTPEQYCVNQPPFLSSSLGTQ